MQSRLREFHDRMFDTVRRAEAMLHDDARDADGLQRTRGEMARTLTSYQLYVHRELYAPMLAGTGAAAEGPRIRLIKAECIAIAEEFRAYRDHWATQDVAVRWDSYHPAALRFCTRIRRHIDDVERIIRDYEARAA